MAEIHILQLGKVDWNQIYKIPTGVHLEYADCFVETPKMPYDLLFLERLPMEEEIKPLYQAAKTYTVFFTDKIFEDNKSIEGLTRGFLTSKKAQHIAARDIQGFLLKETQYYYSKPYGEKQGLKNLAIAQGFSGKVKWNGNYSVTMEGEFGEEFHQIAFWRGNIPLFQLPAMDFWLEYSKSPGVRITMTITKFANGSLSHVLEQWQYSEEELKHVVQVKGNTEDGWLFISLSAKGAGMLEIVALHDRISRGCHGYFLPGGERYTAANREEMFCYFEPGDMKPPLSVYFSGYKTLEGFEGYYMMKGMGCPFLLIAEPRLEGGSFYMGQAEYEQLFVDAIKKYMSELGFSSDQVILSGLSMGTFGALYYGCDIHPHAVILGKPLASIGNVAANEKHLRPGGFPTSLDLLRCQCGGLNEKAIKRLNGKFWNKFDQADWRKSKFVISYMLEDDYDADAYQSLLSHLGTAGAQVYGKGIHGRHNDNTGAIVNWFLTQYKKILHEDFGRKNENE